MTCETVILIVAHAFGSVASIGVVGAAVVVINVSMR